MFANFKRSFCSLRKLHFLVNEYVIRKISPKVAQVLSLTGPIFFLLIEELLEETHPVIYCHIYAWNIAKLPN